MVTGTKAFAEALGWRMARPWMTVTVVRSRGLPVAGFGPLVDETVAQIGVTLRGMGRNLEKARRDKEPSRHVENRAMTRCGTCAEETVAVLESRAGTHHQPGVAKERAEPSQSGR